MIEEAMIEEAMKGEAMKGEEPIKATGFDLNAFNVKYNFRLDEYSSMKLMGPGKVVYTTNRSRTLVTSLFREDEDDIKRVEMKSDETKEVTTISINKMVNMIVVGFKDGNL